jgi:GTPase-activating protein BEM2
MFPRNEIVADVFIQDLLIAAELLEVQTADKIGWLLARELGSIPDEIDIQTIHSYILDIEPSSLVPELGQDRLYRLFPASVRTSLRAHEMLRRWLVSHLADATISVGTRHARAIKLLDAIEITRKRSYGSSAQPVGQRVCVRSFTESVLVSAVLSSPSRAYYHVWQMAASERRVSMDLLSSMFIKGKGETLPERLTVDLGWLLERLLEFISLPNVTEDGGRALVNFDKRR